MSAASGELGRHQLHAYGNADGLSSASRASGATAAILCTEYNGAAGRQHLRPEPRLMKKEGVAAYNWGFVRQDPDDLSVGFMEDDLHGRAPVWFHDIFRTDGTLTARKSRLHPLGQGKAPAK
jgi:hypothetical protein